MLHTTTRMVAMTMILRMAMIILDQNRAFDHQGMRNFVSLLAFPTPMLLQSNKDSDDHFETC